MLYSVLIYGVDGVFDRLPPDEQEALMDKHRALQQLHRDKGTLGPVAKLMGPAAAVTVRRDGDTVQVVDGPFAETKEQLLGFYVLDCETIEEAIEAYTKNSAWATFDEDVKGTLTPGKLADITVLSKDILEIPPEEILNTRVLYTIVGGEVRYRAE